MPLQRRGVIQTGLKALYQWDQRHEHACSAVCDGEDLPHALLHCIGRLCSKVGKRCGAVSYLQGLLGTGGSGCIAGGVSVCGPCSCAWHAAICEYGDERKQRQMLRGK